MSDSPSSGLDNPDSTLEVAVKIKADIERSRIAEPWAFVFGGVDLHLNYFYKLRAEYPKPIKPKDWIDKVYKSYTNFLNTQVLEAAQEKLPVRTYIAAVIHPIVEQNYLPECVSAYTAKFGELLEYDPDPLKEITMAIRMQMVKDFNTMLKEYCASHECFQFLDVNPSITFPDGRVRPDFVDESQLNIHPLWEPALPFWLELQERQIGTT
jgi:hypothetical protein